MPIKYEILINGEIYEAFYPACQGCENLIITGGCMYEGEGCEYPEERKKETREKVKDGR